VHRMGKERPVGKGGGHKGMGGRERGGVFAVTRRTTTEHRLRRRGENHDKPEGVFGKKKKKNRGQINKENNKKAKGEGKSRT